MKAGRSRKLLRVVVSVAVYAVVKLPVAFVLMPSLLPFGHFDDSSDALAVTTYFILIEPFILVGANFCSSRIVPCTDVDDEAPGVAKDAEYHAIRDDPEATGSNN